MSIFTYLYAEKSGDYCDYNGDLKEYIMCLDQDDPDRDFLESILKKSDEIKVCINYHIPIVESSVSNMIIRYKDVMKLEDRNLICPYIFYLKEENKSNAIIVDDDYLVAQGYYYTATEKDAIFNDFKNFMIATDKEKDNIDIIFDKIFKERPSLIQRELDEKMFSSFDDLYEKGQAYAEKVKDDIPAKMLTKDKAKVIQKAVMDWFLIKKAVYVHYMVDKTILNERHEGDTKAQRAQAKHLADGIRFVSIADLWRQNR